MKWFNGKRISNKNVSIAGMVVAVLALSLSIYVSNTPKQKVAKKDPVLKIETFKKLAKKVTKPAHKKAAATKAVAKAPVKKVKPVEKLANYNLIKKSFKPKPRVVAYAGSVKLRANVHLGMDSWNNQHEQVESSTDTMSDDPVGAAAFESKRIQEELAASGL